MALTIYSMKDLDEKLVTHADDWSDGSLTMNLLYFIVGKLYFLRAMFSCLYHMACNSCFCRWGGFGRLFGEYALQEPPSSLLPVAMLLLERLLLQPHFRRLVLPL